MCNYSTREGSVFQFLSTIIIFHLLAKLGHIYQVCSSSLLSALVSALLPFYALILSPPSSHSSPSLSFFPQLKRRDTAINLRVANELHLTIKCTGNGTFHLQEDQWQWQTPFSERLVSGMMFRRQSNQSQRTNTEINQKRKKKAWRFSLYTVFMFFI